MAPGQADSRATDQALTGSADEDEASIQPAQAAPGPSKKARMARFMWRHPWGVVRTLFAILVLIFIAQNSEPVDVDLLFWTLVQVPKLLFILASMFLGAVSWELLRRLFRRAPKADARAPAPAEASDESQG